MGLDMYLVKAKRVLPECSKKRSIANGISKSLDFLH